jgi:ribokinase
MATESPAICVVGSSNIDLTFRTARLPRPGETLSGSAFQLGFGGKGANQAVIAARLGARVAMVSKVGRDVFGEQTLANFRAQGMDTSGVMVDERHSTGTAAIIVDDQAQNCILVVGGANLALTPEDVRRAAHVIQSAKVLVCQLEVPIEATTEAFRLARSAGVQTILNPAPATKLPDELLRLCDYCIPNETEIELLTGQAATTLDGAERGARLLQERGPKTVIVTLGGRGVLVLDGKRIDHIPALDVKAVDTAGAGDAFIGSLAAFLADGLSLPAAVRSANAVAALSVTRLGTQDSYPIVSEVKTFMTSKGLNFGER